VLGEVDAGGNVTYTAKYDVYGATRGSTGSSDSKYKFVGGIGHTTEPDTGGLIYMRARWYDPAAGRFISEDPAGHGINWYIYCDDNPINSTDPSGMFNVWKYLEGKGLGAISGLLFIDVGRRMMGMGIRRYGDGQVMAEEGRFLQYMAGASPSLLGVLIDAPLEATGKVMQIEGGRTCKSAVKMVIQGAMLCMLGNMIEALGEDINYYTGTGVAY
jgi:RHS repeat-associated protein